MKKRSAILFATACLTSTAYADDLTLSSSLETWVYGTSQTLQDGGPLNPGNRVARLPDTQALADTRAQLQGKADAFDFTLRLRSVEQTQKINGATASQPDTYFTQAYARARPSDGWTISAGRMLLTWGPAYLRSPSNPFYYDAGRTEPLRELSGIDAVSALYSGSTWSLQMIEVFGSGHTSGSQAENFSGSQLGNARFDQTHLLKFDWRAEAWLASAIVANQNDGNSYFGSYAQWTVNDAWMVYGEAGNGRRPNDLGTSASGLPYTLTQPSPRASTAIAGLGYTRENGQNINLEYMYDGHGYSSNGERAYFDAAGRAAELPANMTAQQLGTATSDAPVLLARNYLGLIWQSNPQENTQYWRLLATRNLTDQSMQWSAYAEKSINPHVTLFVNGLVNSGDGRTENGAFIKRSVDIGAKFFIL